MLVPGKISNTDRSATQKNFLRPACVWKRPRPSRTLLSLASFSLSAQSSRAHYIYYIIIMGWEDREHKHWSSAPGGGAPLPAFHERPSFSAGTDATWCWPSGSTSSTSGLLSGMVLIIATDDALLKLTPQGCLSTLSRGLGYRYMGAVAAGRLSNGRLLVSAKRALTQRATGRVDDATGGDALFMIDSASERTLGRWNLPTVDASAVVRDEAGSALYALDSADGSLLKLSRDFVPHPSNTWAPGWTSDERTRLENATVGDFSGGRTTLQIHLRRRYATTHPRTPKTATKSAHASALLLGFGYAWVHWSNAVGTPGLTPPRASNLTFVEIQTGALLPPASFAIPLATSGCQNPCFYRGSIVYLDGLGSGLARLHPSGRNERLWAAGAGYEGRGLAILDDLAVFGLRRGRTAHHSGERMAWEARRSEDELVAFDLRSKVMLWRLPLRGSHGAINSVSAPNAANHACVWRACALQLRDDHAPRPEAWAGTLGIASQKQFTWVLPGTH